MSRRRPLASCHGEIFMLLGTRDCLVTGGPPPGPHHHQWHVVTQTLRSSEVIPLPTRGPDRRRPWSSGAGPLSSARGDAAAVEEECAAAASSLTVTRECTFRFLSRHQRECRHGGVAKYYEFPCILSYEYFLIKFDMQQGNIRFVTS